MYVHVVFARPTPPRVRRIQLPCPVESIPTPSPLSSSSPSSSVNYILTSRLYLEIGRRFPLQEKSLFQTWHMSALNVCPFVVPSATVEEPHILAWLLK